MFVHESHTAYRWVRHILSRMGLPIMWVQDADSAIHLIETTDVSLVLTVAGESDRSMRKLFDDIRRISPRTRQLMLKPPRKGAFGSHPLVTALKGALYMPGPRFRDSEVIAH